MLSGANTKIVAMDDMTLLGLFAGALTTIAYLPQLLKIWQTKSAADISWVMLVTLTVGIVLWLVYGLFTHDLPVICANMVTLCLTSMILGLKVHYQAAFPLRLRFSASRKA